MFDEICVVVVLNKNSVTLKMASAQVVEMSVTNNSPSQDSYHLDDLFQSRYATPGFKPFSQYNLIHHHYQLFDKITWLIGHSMTFHQYVQVEKTSQLTTQ